MNDPQEPLERLDDTLPAGVDRRAFLGATAASLIPGLAGCVGSFGGDAGGEQTVTTWRQPWRAEPTWSIEFLAQHNGYWAERGITPPTVTQGDGSPNTARRIGTGANELGTAEIASTVGGWAEGQESYVFGVNKQWNLLSLMWPEGRIEDETDLEGRTVLLSSPFAEATWPVIPDQLDLDIDAIEVEPVSEEVAPGALSEGEGDVVYGSIDTFGFIDDAIEEDLQAVPLSGGIANIIGFPFLVNKEWYDTTDGSEDYLTAILEGYSEAAHWASLNPGETIDFVVNEIEPDLAAADRSALEIQMKWAITLKTGGAAEENGVGFLDVDAVRSSIEILAPVMETDEGSVPDPDDLILEAPSENAEFTTFSDDEWEQVSSHIETQRSLFPN